jgi:hypothetical protein
MKARIALLLICLCGFSYQGFAQGCGVVMEKHYSTYLTESADSSHLYTSVVIDGYGVCQPSASCPCNTAKHTPVATNKIGTVGGTVTGQATCAGCYVSLGNNQQVAATPGQIFNVIGEGDIDCSIVGVFFSQFFNLQIEPAYVRSYGPTPGTGCVYYPSSGVTLCQYAVKSWCTAATSPPDFNLVEIVADKKTLLPFFEDSIGACARTIVPKGPWVCSKGLGLMVSQGNFPFPLGNCTHNP